MDYYKVLMKSLPMMFLKGIDTVTTFIGVSNYGIYWEGNPNVRHSWINGYFFPSQLLAFPLLVVLNLIYVFIHSSKNFNNETRIIVSFIRKFLIIIFSVIAIVNLIALHPSMN